MHFNFQVDDLQYTVAIRIGATKVAKQYGGVHFVTMLDTQRQGSVKNKMISEYEVKIIKQNFSTALLK